MRLALDPQPCILCRKPVKTGIVMNSILSRRVRLLLLPALAAAVMWSARAASGSMFNVPRVDASRLSPDICGLTASDGEITGVSPGHLRMRGAGGEVEYEILPACAIYANGLPASLAALRPVTDEAFFWARIWRDGRLTVKAVEAVYCGGELLVQSVAGPYLLGVSMETGGEVRLALAVPGQTLRPGRLVYVLLDLEGRVRWYQRLN